MPPGAEGEVGRSLALLRPGLLGLRDMQRLEALRLRVDAVEEREARPADPQLAQPRADGRPATRPSRKASAAASSRSVTSTAARGLTSAISSAWFSNSL